MMNIKNFLMSVVAVLGMGMMGHSFAHVQPKVDNGSSGIMATCNEEMINYAKKELSDFYKTKQKYIKVKSDGLKIFSYCKKVKVKDFIFAELPKDFKLPKESQSTKDIWVWLGVNYCADNAQGSSLLRECGEEDSEEAGIKYFLSNIQNAEIYKHQDNKSKQPWSIGLGFSIKFSPDNCPSDQNATEGSGSVSSDNNGSDDNESDFECNFALGLTPMQSDSQSD